MALDSTKTPQGGTQRDLAKQLGLHESRVAQMAKRGMPTDSVEAARAWRLQNQQRPNKKKPNIARVEVPTIPDKDHDESDDSYLIRVRNLEQSIYKSLVKALASDPESVLFLQQWHTRACTARNSVEEAMLEVETKRGTLMDKATALQILTETIGAILLQTDSIPKLYAAKFPGLEPEITEPILQEISNDIRRKTEAWIRQNKLNQ